MSDQTESVGPAEADEDGQAARAEQAAERARLPVAKRRRFSIPILIAAAIMFLTMASYVANGILLFLDLDVFGRGFGTASVAAGALTPEGERLVLGSVYLFFAAIALVVLVGFLLLRGWAWSAAMTWTAITLAVGLVAYFIGESHYLSMLAGVILMLVLNQAAVHRAFRIEER
jgi:membrane-anchored protein YejM (alkaline phosphatase superfamily)